MINIVLYIMFFLFSLPVIASGSGDSLMSKTKEILDCFKGSTASSTNCMIGLEKTKRIEYNKTYNDFIKKANKEDLSYPEDFIYNIIESKRNFDNHMKGECRAYSLINSEKDSYAYYATYSRCMVTLYDQRIKFYKDYDFS